jgi:molecular chaperone HscB
MALATTTENKLNMNHFEFFGLPMAFKIDAAALRRAYLLNSKKYHPDYHTLADDAQQASMLELSTLNNEAYAVLNDDDARMRYLLEIHGLIGDESDQKALPQDFLMDMMDINEAIMDLQFDPDPVRYSQTLDQVNQLEAELFASISPILETWTSDAGADALQPVQKFFLKKRYLLRVIENLSTFAPS